MFTNTAFGLTGGGMLARLAWRRILRCAASVAKASVNRTRRSPVTLRQLTVPAASDNFNEALLARLAHLQSLPHLVEGGDRSRDVYGAAHTNILDQIDRLIYGHFGPNGAKGIFRPSLG